MNFFSRFLNGQMIFERMETRILVGITTFVATMVLIGWVAINETSRMAAFDRQFLSRSIERGGELYTTNCATCHGPNGLGIGGRAPALNNPQLFGYDYIPEINSARNPLIAERDQLQDELDAGATPEREAEINTRLGEVEIAIADLEQQAQPFFLSASQAILRGYDPYRPSRTTNVNWAGTTFNFVYSTLIHGRPVSSRYWPQAMPNWAQVSGGPLRDDQIRDVTNYIMNYNREFTLDDLFLVNQFAIEPCNPVACEGGTGSGEPTVNDVIDDVGFEGLREQFDALEADPTQGQALYNGQVATGIGLGLGCAGCHVGGLQGPNLEGTWTRVIDERLPALPDYADGQDYLIHSIVRPDEYIVDTYSSGVMLNVFGDQLTVQDLADLVAYLASQDQ